MLAVLRVLQIKKGFAINSVTSDLVYRLASCSKPWHQQLCKVSTYHLQHVLSRQLNDSKNRVVTHNGHKKVLCY